VLENMAENSPENQKHFADYLAGNCFGDYVTRSGVDLKTRELLTFSMLLSLGGCESQLKGHTQGRGYLTGAINENTKFASVDIRSRNPRFTQEAIKVNRVVIELLERIGAEKGGATPAQVALAWVLAQKTWIVPIPGSRKLAHLDENLGALDLELTAEDLNEIRAAMANITVVGNRY